MLEGDWAINEIQHVNTPWWKHRRSRRRRGLEWFAESFDSVLPGPYCTAKKCGILKKTIGRHSFWQQILRSKGAKARCEELLLPQWWTVAISADDICKLRSHCSWRCRGGDTSLADMLMVHYEDLLINNSEFLNSHRLMRLLTFQIAPNGRQVELFWWW